MNDLIKWYVVPFLVLCVGLLVVCSVARAENVDVERIVQLESSGNPKAVNGRHYGLMQLSEGVLHDYNKRHGTAWGVRDLFGGELNRRIGTWYLNTEIPRLLRHYKLGDSVRNRITAWRFGVGSVIKGVHAERYITAYYKVNLK